MIISKYATDDGVTIFRLSGKLISASLDKIKAALDGAITSGEIRIVMNFKEVSVVDSVSTGLLVSRFKAVMKKGGCMSFCGLAPAILKLLTLADLESSLCAYPAEEEALAAVREKSGRANKSAD